MKEITTTYTIYSRHFIPDGIHYNESMREEPRFNFYAGRILKQSNFWYHFSAFGMSRPGIEHTTSRNEAGRRSTTTLDLVYNISYWSEHCSVSSECIDVQTDIVVH